MASFYQFKNNLINDFFIQTLMIYNEDISEEAPQNEIKYLLKKFLSEYVEDIEEVDFNFDIYNTDEGLKVIANNFATSLFFNNIITAKFNEINLQETLEINDLIYSFDQVNKCLIKKHN